MAVCWMRRRGKAECISRLLWNSTCHAVIERVFEADEFPDQGVVATEGARPLG